MKKVSIIGHFSFRKETANGQTIKTKIVADEVCQHVGKDEVLLLDTSGGIKRLLTILPTVMKALYSSRRIIILPAHNGIRIIAPLLVLGNFLFQRKLYYIVIGGWLPKMLEERRPLSWVLKRMDTIFVETNTMKVALEAQGFRNIKIMPNCKKLNILSREELVNPTTEPLKLCTFSRVAKEKGIEDAVNAVNAVNLHLNRTAFTLDIYGQVDADQGEWFETLQEGFSPCIRYCGCISYDKSVEILKDYFALLFPTKFYTEGIPGTVIDAYSAGLPVISAVWESFNDVIEENKTGIGYRFARQEELVSVLTDVALCPDTINQMRVACLEKAKEFTSDRIWEILKAIGF